MNQFQHKNLFLDEQFDMLHLLNFYDHSINENKNVLNGQYILFHFD